MKLKNLKELKGRNGEGTKIYEQMIIDIVAATKQKKKSLIWKAKIFILILFFK